MVCWYAQPKQRRSDLSSMETASSTRNNVFSTSSGSPWTRLRGLLRCSSLEREPHGGGRAPGVRPVHEPGAGRHGGQQDQGGHRHGGTPPLLLSGPHAPLAPSPLVSYSRCLRPSCSAHLASHRIRKQMLMHVSCGRPCRVTNRSASLTRQSHRNVQMLGTGRVAPHLLPRQPAAHHCALRRAL